MSISWGIIWEIVLGGMPVENFMAYTGLMAAGALVFFTLDVNHATRKDLNTPQKFSWGFMLRDNILRALGVAIAIMASVIWYEDLFGVAINARLAFMGGLGIDATIGILMKKGKATGAMKQSRAKLIQKYG